MHVKQQVDRSIYVLLIFRWWVLFELQNAVFFNGIETLPFVILAKCIHQPTSPHVWLERTCTHILDSAEHPSKTSVLATDMMTCNWYDLIFLCMSYAEIMQSRSTNVHFGRWPWHLNQAWSRSGRSRCLTTDIFTWRFIVLLSHVSFDIVFYSIYATVSISPHHTTLYFFL